MYILLSLQIQLKCHFDFDTSLTVCPSIIQLQIFDDSRLAYPFTMLSILRDIRVIWTYSKCGLHLNYV